MDERAIDAVAELFKVLGNTSRLSIVLRLVERPQTVGALVLATGLSQPLVSQHLRTLRNAGIVRAERSGKEISYSLADEHVSHVVADALIHAQEPSAVEHAEDGHPVEAAEESS